MDKLNLASPDLVNENIARIAAIFPHCITESDAGTAVDLDLLRQELGHRFVEGGKERYRLEWPGKREAVATANTPVHTTLRPVKDASVNFSDTENLYIEGDNLEVLKLLQESYHGKIRMIYIDPPYNTGNDFVYKDNFAQQSEIYKKESGQKDEYSRRLVMNPETSGRYHSDWLSMIYPRLKLARNMLSDDGVIFLSIDDNELYNLKKLGDEIFGEANFVASFPRITKKAGKTTGLVARNHDYVLCFRKSPAAGLNACAFDVDGYDHTDEYENERGRYKLSQTLDYGSIQYSPSLDYEITIDGQVLRPGNVSREEMLDRQKRNPKSDFCWRWSKDLYEFGVNNGFIVLKKSRNGHRIYTKTYEKATIFRGPHGYAVEDRDRTKTCTTLDLLDNKFSNDNSRKDLGKLFNEKIFEYSKPVSLIAELITLATTGDDIILDFFSGSATTAHAVLHLNAVTGSKRKYIMVQVPEPVDAHMGYDNICEIGKERIRRAAAKIKEETGADFDDGFRVYRLDSSNMQNVYLHPQHYRQQALDMLADKIKPDRTADDLLAQAMLGLGLPLSLKTEQITIAGKNVLKVADNALYACFEDDIDEAFAKALAAHAPLRFVCRDGGFKNDAAKINIRQLLPGTIMKVI